MSLEDDHTIFKLFSTRPALQARLFGASPETRQPLPCPKQTDKRQQHELGRRPTDREPRSSVFTTINDRLAGLAAWQYHSTGPCSNANLQTDKPRSSFEIFSSTPYFSSSDKYSRGPDQASWMNSPQQAPPLQAGPSTAATSSPQPLFNETSIAAIEGANASTSSIGTTMTWEQSTQTAVVTESPKQTSQGRWADFVEPPANRTTVAVQQGMSSTAPEVTSLVDQDESWMVEAPTRENAAELQQELNPQTAVERTVAASPSSFQPNLPSNAASTVTFQPNVPPEATSTATFKLKVPPGAASTATCQPKVPPVDASTATFQPSALPDAASTATFQPSAPFGYPDFAPPFYYPQMFPPSPFGYPQLSLGMPPPHWVRPTEFLGPYGHQAPFTATPYTDHLLGTGSPPTPALPHTEVEQSLAAVNPATEVDPASLNVCNKLAEEIRALERVEAALSQVDEVEATLRLMEATRNQMNLASVLQNVPDLQPPALNLSTTQSATEGKGGTEEEAPVNNKKRVEEKAPEKRRARSPAPKERQPVTLKADAACGPEPIPISKKPVVVDTEPKTIRVISWKMPSDDAGTVRRVTRHVSKHDRIKGRSGKAHYKHSSSEDESYRRRSPRRSKGWRARSRSRTPSPSQSRSRSRERQRKYSSSSSSDRRIRKGKSRHSSSESERRRSSRSSSRSRGRYSSTPERSRMSTSKGRGKSRKSSIASSVNSSVRYDESFEGYDRGSVDESINESVASARSIAYSTDSVPSSVASSPRMSMQTSAPTKTRTTSSRSGKGRTGRRSIEDVIDVDVGAVSSDDEVAEPPIRRKSRRSGSSARSVRSVSSVAESVAYSMDGSIHSGSGSVAESVDYSMDESILSASGRGSVAESVDYSMDESIRSGSGHGSVAESVAYSMDESIRSASGRGSVVESVAYSMDESIHDSAYDDGSIADDVSDHRSGTRRDGASSSSKRGLSAVLKNLLQEEKKFQAVQQQALKELRKYRKGKGSADLSSTDGKNMERLERQLQSRERQRSALRRKEQEMEDDVKRKKRKVQAIRRGKDHRSKGSDSMCEDIAVDSVADDIQSEIYSSVADSSIADFDASNASITSSIAQDYEDSFASMADEISDSLANASGSMSIDDSIYSEAASIMSSSTVVRSSPSGSMGEDIASYRSSGSGSIADDVDSSIRSGSIPMGSIQDSIATGSQGDISIQTGASIDDNFESYGGSIADDRSQRTSDSIADSIADSYSQSRQSDSIADSIADSYSQSRQSGSIADSIADSYSQSRRSDSIADSIAGGSFAQSVRSGSIADSIADSYTPSRRSDSIADSIADGSFASSRQQAESMAEDFESYADSFEDMASVVGSQISYAQSIADSAPASIADSNYDQGSVASIAYSGSIADSAYNDSFNSIAISDAQPAESIASIAESRSVMESPVPSAAEVESGRDEFSDDFESQIGSVADMREVDDDEIGFERQDSIISSVPVGSVPPSQRGDGYSDTDPGIEEVDDQYSEDYSEDIQSERMSEHVSEMENDYENDYEDEVRSNVDSIASDVEQSIRSFQAGSDDEMSEDSDIDGQGLVPAATDSQAEMPSPPITHPSHTHHTHTTHTPITPHGERTLANASPASTTNLSPHQVPVTPSTGSHAQTGLSERLPKSAAMALPINPHFLCATPSDTASSVVGDADTWHTSDFTSRSTPSPYTSASPHAYSSSTPTPANPQGGVPSPEKTKRIRKRTVPAAYRYNTLDKRSKSMANAAPQEDAVLTSSSPIDQAMDPVTVSPGTPSPAQGPIAPTPSTKLDFNADTPCPASNDPQPSEPSLTPALQRSEICDPEFSFSPEKPQPKGKATAPLPETRASGSSSSSGEWLGVTQEADFMAEQFLRHMSSDGSDAEEVQLRRRGTVYNSMRASSGPGPTTRTADYPVQSTMDKTPPLASTMDQNPPLAGQQTSTAPHTHLRARTPPFATSQLRSGTPTWSPAQIVMLDRDSHNRTTTPPPPPQWLEGDDNYDLSMTSPVRPNSLMGGDKFMDKSDVDYLEALVARFDNLLRPSNAIPSVPEKDGEDAKGQDGEDAKCAESPEGTKDAEDAEDAEDAVGSSDRQDGGLEGLALYRSRTPTNQEIPCQAMSPPPQNVHAQLPLTPHPALQHDSDPIVSDENITICTPGRALGDRDSPSSVASSSNSSQKSSRSSAARRLQLTSSPKTVHKQSSQSTDYSLTTSPIMAPAPATGVQPLDMAADLMPIINISVSPTACFTYPHPSPPSSSPSPSTPSMGDVGGHSSVPPSNTITPTLTDASSASPNEATPYPDSAYSSSASGYNPRFHKRAMRGYESEDSYGTSQSLTYTDSTRSLHSSDSELDMDSYLSQSSMLSRTPPSRSSSRSSSVSSVHNSASGRSGSRGSQIRSKAPSIMKKKARIRLTAEQHAEQYVMDHQAQRRAIRDQLHTMAMAQDNVQQARVIDYVQQLRHQQGAALDHIQQERSKLAIKSEAYQQQLQRWASSDRQGPCQQEQHLRQVKEQYRQMLEQASRGAFPHPPTP